MLKHITVAILVSLGLSGCAQKLWFGASSHRDFYECKQDAARTYSPTMYNATIGNGYKTPSYTTCNAYGNSASCTTTGGNYVPPAQVTLDANQNNRDNHFNYCMVSRGNQLMTQAEYDAQGASRHRNEELTPRQEHIRLREMCRDKYSPRYNPDTCEKPS